MAFFGHVLLAFLVILSVWMVEQIFHFFWQDREPMLFNLVPLAWVFQFIDLVILAVFAFWGASEANDKLRGR